MNIFEKISKKITELWKKSNIFQKICLAIVIGILAAIKLLKWALILKVCCGWLIWLKDSLLQVL